MSIPFQVQIENYHNQIENYQNQIENKILKNNFQGMCTATLRWFTVYAKRSEKGD